MPKQIPTNPNQNMLHHTIKSKDHDVGIVRERQREIERELMKSYLKSLDFDHESKKKTTSRMRIEEKGPTLHEGVFI